MTELFDRNMNITRSFKPVLDGMMSAVHFGPVEKPVALVFLHANGFHGLAFRTILEPLAKEMNVHILALDQRGHGLSELASNDEKFATFPSFACDLITYLKKHVEGEPVIAGLSMGASAALIAADLAPEKINKVVAFDPVIMPLAVRLMMATKPGRRQLRKRVGMAKSARRRRNRFESRETAFHRYQGRGPFKHLSDEALWDYIRDGVISEDQGVRLACRPDWEATIYTSQSHNMKRYIARAPSSSHIILTPYMKPSQRWIRKIAHRRPDIKLEYRPELEHFFPLINPDIAITALRKALLGAS